MHVSTSGAAASVAPLATTPAHLDLLYSSAVLEGRLGELAAELDQWATAAEAETGRLLLAVCVLRGGVFFFSDLLLRMEHSAEPGFCRAWSYAKQTNAQPEATLRLDWQELAVTGRDVVLVDNICDSGRTLATAAAWLVNAGARRVRTVVMAYRTRADSQHAPTLTGFVYPGREWLVGYGLRDGDARLMNTRCIYTVRGSGG